MDPALQVRAFRSTDAPALTELLHAAYAPLGARGLNYTAVDQDEATTLRRASAGQCWVVHRSGDLTSNRIVGPSTRRLVGTLTTSMPPSPELLELTAHARAPRMAWINQVAVDPAQQRSGIASHLWGLALAWATEADASAIGVDTAVPADHLIRLYASWGFDHRDRIHWPGKKYDSVVMTRPLVPPEGP